MKRAALAACVLSLLLPLAAAQAEPRTHVIEVANMAFAAAPADVHVGDTVIWRNRDMFRHTATARDGGFDIDLPAGGEGSAVLRTAGEIAYFCRFHPTMKAVLKIEP